MTTDRLTPVTPLPSAANMRSVQTVRSTQTRWIGVEVPGIALAGTADALFMLALLSFPHPLSCLPSLGVALLFPA